MCFSKSISEKLMVLFFIMGAAPARCKGVLGPSQAATGGVARRAAAPYRAAFGAPESAVSASGASMSTSTPILLIARVPEGDGLNQANHQRSIHLPPSRSPSPPICCACWTFVDMAKT